MVNYHHRKTKPFPNRQGKVSSIPNPEYKNVNNELMWIVVGLRVSKQGLRRGCDNLGSKFSDENQSERIENVADGDFDHRVIYGDRIYLTVDVG